MKATSFCLTHHIFKDEMDPIESECARSVQSSLIFYINHAENYVLKAKFTQQPTHFDIFFYKLLSFFAQWDGGGGW